VDLNNPEIAQNWRDFQRARRADEREARAQYFNELDYIRREQRLLNRSEQAVYDGLTAMRAGDYRQAVVEFTLAAELNNGDPVCRIHLAQAQVALGHDREAARALRRALDLQPKLVPMRLGLDQYYPDPEEFTEQLQDLERRIDRKRASRADIYVLLGFLKFQHGDDDAAYRAFRQAVRGLPRDDRVHEYLELTKPAER
jgi:Flp pilus assembly protein TadD